MLSFRKKSGKVPQPSSDHLRFHELPLRSFRGRNSQRLYVHGWHALVQHLRPHQLNAGHDLFLVTHQRHPESLDVSARHTDKTTEMKS